MAEVRRTRAVGVGTVRISRAKRNKHGCPYFVVTMEVAHEFVAMPHSGRMVPRRVSSIICPN